VHHAVALSLKNQVYSWGFDNRTGRLGHGYSYQDQMKLTTASGDNDKKDKRDLNQEIKKPLLVDFVNNFLLNE
jgi:alpha-tubulin suppressor-like RCC1 family protein